MKSVISVFFGKKNIKLYSLTSEQVKECFKLTICEKVCDGFMFANCKGPESCDQFKDFFAMVECIAIINEIDRIQKLNKD